MTVRVPSLGLKSAIRPRVSSVIASWRSKRNESPTTTAALAKAASASPLLIEKSKATLLPSSGWTTAWAGSSASRGSLTGSERLPFNLDQGCARPRPPPGSPPPRLRPAGPARPRDPQPKDVAAVSGGPADAAPRRSKVCTSGLRSAPVSTASTPGADAAAAVSIATIRACGCELRTKHRCSMRGSLMSSI